VYGTPYFSSQSASASSHSAVVQHWARRERMLDDASVLRLIGAVVDGNRLVLGRTRRLHLARVRAVPAGRSLAVVLNVYVHRQVLRRGARPRYDKQRLLDISDLRLVV
jgi:hypothetical protein